MSGDHIQALDATDGEQDLVAAEMTGLGRKGGTGIGKPGW